MFLSLFLHRKYLHRGFFFTFPAPFFAFSSFTFIFEVGAGGAEGDSSEQSNSGGINFTFGASWKYFVTPWSLMLRPP